jgi:methyl-accepting chemotaxis protein
VGQLNRRIDTLAREIELPDETRAAGAAEGTVHRALGEVAQGVANIASAADQSRGVCDGLQARMAGIEAEMRRTTHALDTAMTGSEAFLRVSEQLIEMVAASGLRTEDTPFIHAAQETAARIGALFEQAVASGAVSAADLFDERYQPVAGTQPQQHTARFNALTDRLLPQAQEPVLALSDKVVFCIAADRNGYVSTHNQRYCKPQRGDPAWDTANSRWRRVFDDRTGLASARNRKPFLLQTYRRDMGGGQFVVMKEVAAPITVNGRHWGGLRLAYRF